MYLAVIILSLEEVAVSTGVCPPELQSPSQAQLFVFIAFSPAA